MTGEIRHAITEYITNGHYQLMKLAHPLTAVALEITSRCNLDCRHCCIRRHRRDDEIPYAEIETTLKRLPRSGWRKPFIAVTGGEPLCHRRCDDILQLLDREGYAFSLCSNGLLMDRARVETFNALKNLTSVGISLDGDCARHELLRGKKTYAPALAALELLADNSNKRITVKTVVHRDNLTALPDVWNVVRNHRVATWHILPLMAYNDAELQTLILTQEHQETVKKQLCAYARDTNATILFDEQGDVRRDRSGIRCLQGITACTIAANGDILACPHAPVASAQRCGSIYQDDIARVWNTGFTGCRQSSWRHCAHHEPTLGTEVLQ